MWLDYIVYFVYFGNFKKKMWFPIQMRQNLNQFFLNKNVQPQRTKDTRYENDICVYARWTEISLDLNRFLEGIQFIIL